MKRTERRVVAALTGVAMVATALCVGQAASATAPTPMAVRLPVQSQGSPSQGSQADSVTVQFVGDTMLADSAQPAIDELGYDWPLAGVSHLLDGDVVVANAEAPITELARPVDEVRRYSYNALTPAASALAQAGIDVLGLANNHAMDRGAAGLADTLDAAGEAGMTTFGAAATLAEAEAPLILQTAVGDVAIVAMGENYGARSTATQDHAGIPVLSRKQVHRSAALARAAGADWIVAYVHWGENYLGVEEKQERYAQVFSEAGYDAVIGSGPHVVQRVDVIDGMPVLYSLGNFVFGTNGRFAQFDADGKGLIASLTFQPGAQVGVELRCLQTDNANVAFQPKSCSLAQSQELMSQLNPAIEVDSSGAGRLVLASDQQAKTNSTGTDSAGTD